MRENVEKNHCLKTEQDGSITLFLALVLMLVFSFLFSLLEAARVQGLAQIARRSLLLELESAFGEYQTELWEDYRLLFLDGSNEAGELDLALMEGHRIEEAALEQKGASFYQMALRDLEITGYTLATDDAGAAFEKQACLAIQRQLAAGAAEALQGKLGKGREVAEEGQSLKEQWDAAKDAMGEADELKKEAGKGKFPDGEEKGQNKAEFPEEGKEKEQNKAEFPEEGKEQEKARFPDGAKKNLPENPVKSVDLLKKSAILSVVVENPSEISGKAIPLQGTLKYRTRAEGNLKSPKGGALDKMWFLQYLDYYFSCKTDSGKGGSAEHALDYELEYCVAGKSSDRENLEKTVKKLLLIREAGNFATIMQDGKKQALALEIATAAVGFTGIPVLIQAVQIGILLAWSYIESILDVRCLLSGGKVALVKKITDWKSDVSLGQKVLEEKEEKAKNQKDGWSYREYLQILLLLVKEETLVYRAMDVVEQNMALQTSSFRMDHQIHGIRAEGLYSAEPLFLGLITAVKVKDGTYHFRESRSYSYLE